MNKNEFRAFISSNYEKMKSMIQHLCKKQNIPFNEDIYEDTVLKCLQGDDIRHPTKYLAIAYKLNYINDRDKACNRYCHDALTDINIYNIDDSIMSLDLHVIYNIIKDKFGEDMLELYKKQLCGWSIREIEGLSGKSGLAYQFKKINQYIRDLYKKEKVS